MRKIVWVLTSLEDGALPNILNELAPWFSKLNIDLTVMAIEAFPQDSQSFQELKKQSVTVVSLGKHRRDLWGAFWGLKSWLKANKPDLIHGHLGRAELFSVWCAPRGTPVMTTFHSVRRNYSRLTLWGYRSTDKAVTHRTSVSQASADSFYSDGFLKSPHTVIYNPVSARRLVPQKTPEEMKSLLGFSEGLRFIVTVGRFIPAKGLMTLLKAFSRLRSEDKSLRLILVGNGPLKSELQSKAAELGVNESILWPGFCPAADFLQLADVVAFPSLWEGLGLVPIEAMLMKRPVVASRLPAIEEFITDGVDGVLVSPGDDVALEEGLRKVLEDPLLASQRAESALKRAKSMFDPQKIASQYAELYEQLSKKF